MQEYQRGSMEGIPSHAQTRLKQGKSLFTSDLSVSEFLLAKEAGFEPIGLVMGSSIYHLGWQTGGVRDSYELEVLTQAMYHARELAMTRMEEEADALEADGIIGVRIEVSRSEWGENLSEFMAIGTAVRARDGHGSFRAPSGRPFTSDLSGQDFWTLLKAGYRPVGLTMGTCVYHVGYQGVKQWFSQVGRNCEMPTYTQALYDARELALSRMQAEAARESAEGIVGVRVEEKSHGWGSHVIEYFAIGTAIIATRADHEIPAPTLTVSLNDNGPSNVRFSSGI